MSAQSQTHLCLLRHQGQEFRASYVLFLLVPQAALLGVSCSPGFSDAHLYLKEEQFRTEKTSS